MRRLLIALLAAIVSTTVVLAQGGTGTTQLVGAEYFYDTDPGYGQATYINNVTEGENSLTLSVDGLSPGAHMLYVRSLESSGMWSATRSCPILLTPQRADNVARVEYFFDTDPGYGLGSSVSATNGENVLPLNISGMATGIHHLNLRSQDAAGNWSTTLSQSLFIVSPHNASLVRVEYFFDNDPGYGQATAISGALAADATYALPLDGLAAGAHLLCIRAMDSYGRWSSVVSTPLFVTGHPANAVAAEYFLDDNDPGVGQATPVALPADLSQPIIIAASTDGLAPGDHTITIRVLNDLGFWTAVVAGTTFTVNAPAVPEAYAVLSDGGTVVTFYYDDKKAEREGIDINNAWFDNDHASPYGTATTAVFDASFDTYRPTSTAYWFYRCSSLATITGIEYLHTDDVTSMEDMFTGCSSLTSIDVSNFKTDNVTLMFGLFSACSSLTSIDVSNFNTSNVMSIGGMFSGCSGLTSIDVSNFNTANVTDLSAMFFGCSGLTTLDLSNFNTAKVTNMNFMFENCSNLTTIYAGDGWSTEKVTEGNSMFSKCTALVGGMGTVFDAEHVDADYAHIDGGAENPGYLTDKHAAFAYAVLSGDGTVVTFYYDDKKAERGGIDINNDYVNDDATSPYGTATTAVFDASFDTYRPTSTAYWFMKCESLTAITGIEYLHTDNVTDMSNMFYGCSGLTSLDVSNFNTVNVADMDMLFYHCSNLTVLDVTNFNTGNVINMDGMFRYCSNLTSLDVTNFNTEKVWNMDYMFGGCSNLTSLDVSNFNTANVSTMFGMFDGCSGLTSLNVSNFNTANVTRMMAMFENCSGLTSLNVTNFNTENVTTMRGMFHGCSGLNSLDVTYFNTTNVTDMCDMFAWCSGLTSLDLTNFNTANVTDMNVMFSNCSNLKTIYAGDGWNTGKVSQSEGMFNDCTALVGGMGTVYDVNHVDAAYAHIDGGTANPGYLTDKNATPAMTEAYAVLSADSLTVTFYYDDKKAVRGGIGINKDWIDGDKASPYGTATTAVFDESFDTYRPTDAAFWFMNCSSLTTITGIEYLHTDDVLYMGYMFHGCSSLTSLDVSNFNTGNVTSMDGMFFNCSSLTSLDVSNFNTANVTNMWGMFSGCGGLTSLDLSNFNTANVTDMSGMFQNCSSLTTIYAGNFDLTSMEASSSMFTGCTALVGGMGTVYDANHVDAAYAHIDGGTANPGYFTDKNATPAVTEAYAVLSEGNTVLTFYYDDQKNMRGGMNVGPLDYTRDSSGDYNIPDRPWETNIGDITTVVFDPSFADNTTLTSTAFWFTRMDKMATLTGLEYLNTANVTDMRYMFANCSALSAIDVSSLNTSAVLNMDGMFSNCSGLSALSFENFNTSKVNSMTGMFYGCSNLRSIDVSSFNTASVTDMSGMFYSCTNLQSLDLSSFNTANVTDMGVMFAECASLQTLNISGFNTAQADLTGIFNGCTSLAAIQAGSAAIPTEEYERVHNPNLLVYVNDESVAPAGVQNVVVGGLAKEIVLTDATTDGNYNFHVPEAFEAEKISYSHNYTQQTTPGVSRGWESLVLPFTVQTITHERNGELKPYKSQPGDKTFWLRTLTATGIKAAARIVANMPYLISMPNNTAAYDEEYCQGGVVTFASQNVTVPQTRMTVAALSDSSIVMRPTMLRVSQSPSVYALNIGEPRGSYLEGSVFERDLRSVRPFECYTEHATGTGGSRFITLSDLNGGDATAIQHIEDVLTDEQPIYNVAGQMVSDGKQSRKLTKGVYIQHGRKVVK